VCGLSIFATYLSSISYLALPGKSFSTNWNPFVFSLSIPLVAWIAVRWFLPYYRNSGEVSAYALLEKRFGAWARIYCSCFYLLTQVARIGVVLYLMALPMQVIFGWDIYTILVVTGLVVTAYSLIGGIVAVIWADAIQAIVLMVGALISLVVMLATLPGGISQVMDVAQQHNKFSLGSFGPSLLMPTFWVVLLYGVVENLRNFGIDQSYIQRYIASKSERDARRSVWLGGLLYVPVSAMFFFIGTTLFTYYGANNTVLPPGTDRGVTVAESQTKAVGDLSEVRNIVARQKLLQQGVRPEDPIFAVKQAEIASGLELEAIGDRVFPHFIAAHLPPGLTGLLIAAVFAAAMSTVSTSLNSSATLVMTDYYKRFFNRDATERQSMIALYVGTIIWGVLGTGLALLLVSLTESALDIWWTFAGIFGGGMTGIFLLSIISRRAGKPAAITGVSLGVVVILWMSIPKLVTIFSPGITDEFFLGRWWVSPFHAFMVNVFGTLVIVLIGHLVSLAYRDTANTEGTKKTA
jgi:SSS family solute:Na+ symporter